jgi:hypothetical protein
VATPGMTPRTGTSSRRIVARGSEREFTLSHRENASFSLIANGLIQQTVDEPAERRLINSSDVPDLAGVGAPGSVEEGAPRPHGLQSTHAEVMPRGQQPPWRPVRQTIAE